MSFKAAVKWLYAEVGEPPIEPIAEQLGLTNRTVEAVLVDGDRRQWPLVESIIEKLGGSPEESARLVERIKKEWDYESPEPRRSLEGMPEVIVCMNDGPDADAITQALSLLAPLGVLKPAPHGWLVVPFGAGSYVITDER